MDCFLSNMKQFIIDEVPESGPLKKNLILLCDVTGTDNEYMYKVEKYPRDPEGIILQLEVGVCRKGDDRLLTHYIFKGTKQEMLGEFDRLKEKPDECLAEVMELSDRVDELYE